jgi:hypothetical protein
VWHELAHNQLSEHTPAFYDLVSAWAVGLGGGGAAAIARVQSPWSLQFAPC